LIPCYHIRIHKRYMSSQQTSYYRSSEEEAGIA
jgi:hypothetical protein